MGYRNIGGSSGSSGSHQMSVDDGLGPITVKANDLNNTPTDSGALTITITQGETNNTPTETAAFKIGNINDSNATPTDARSAIIAVWLNGSTGTSNVTSPTNADGANNAVVATVTTLVAESAIATLSSLCGNNISAIVFTSAIYRGWFKSVNTLVTSTTTIRVRSVTALFADIIMFSNSGLNTTVDNLSGNFTFDLIAAGVNTLVKLQSVQIISETSDSVPGVTPAVLTVDAGRIELTNTL